PTIRRGRCRTPSTSRPRDPAACCAPTPRRCRPVPCSSAGCRCTSRARAPCSAPMSSTPPTPRCSTRSRAVRATRASRWRTSWAPWTPWRRRCSAASRSPACAPATSPSPSRAPRWTSAASPARRGTASITRRIRAAGSAAAPAGSRWAAAAWSTPPCCAPWAWTRRSTRASPSASASSASSCCATGCPTCTTSWRATSASPSTTGRRSDMPRIPLTWLAEHTALPEGTSAESVAAALVSVGLEEEGIFGAQVTGPLVVGRVLELVGEPQKNGKTINWVRVDVGPEHNEDADNPKDPQPGQERPSRGIVCGAHNFAPGDLVVVSLPGTVLPGDFAIAARKTYGHVSDGMICSGEELGLGPDPAGEDGIIVLGRGHGAGLTAEPGDDAIALLGLADEVVEINVTPDRGYCFSLRGVAREYSHSTGAAYTDPVAEIPLPESAGGGVEIRLQDDAPLRGGEGCSRFVAVGVTGVDPTAQTPRWMARRLPQGGMRPISLSVDVTTSVMRDLGQPLHAYDAQTLVAASVVRRARAGEELTTRDDVARTLDPEDLLITDSEGGDGARVLGLAGVM